MGGFGVRRSCGFRGTSTDLVFATLSTRLPGDRSTSPPLGWFCSFSRRSSPRSLSQSAPKAAGLFSIVASELDTADAI